VSITRRTVIAATFGGLLIAPAFVPVWAADASKPPAVYQEYVLGNPKSKVTVIEYASLTCPHCAHFQEEEYPKLKAAYIDTNKIKYIYRDFPLDGLATGAALLARCAPNGRGITMIDLMFKNQNEWTRAEQPLVPLKNYAKLSGMDDADVDSCLKNQPMLKEIQNVQEKAVNLYKVQGTPTFFVNEELVDGVDFDALKAAIDKKLK
jgi:protein-disulfide isomerase